MAKRDNEKWHDGQWRHIVGIFHGTTEQLRENYKDWHIIEGHKYLPVTPNLNSIDNADGIHLAQLNITYQQAEDGSTHMLIGGGITMVGIIRIGEFDAQNSKMVIRYATPEALRYCLPFLKFAEIKIKLADDKSLQEGIESAEHPTTAALNRPQPERKDLIDIACIQWAGKGYLPKYTMEEFLDDFYKQFDIYLSKDEFKRALQNAGERGLIVKGNSGRWETRA